jgi:hypothetical protein
MALSTPAPLPVVSATVAACFVHIYKGGVYERTLPQPRTLKEAMIFKSVFDDDSRDLVAFISTHEGAAELPAEI